MGLCCLPVICTISRCWVFNKEIKKITEQDFERKNTAVLLKENYFINNSKTSIYRYNF